MTAVIIIFRKSNKKSQEHHARAYVIGQVGKKTILLFVLILLSLVLFCLQKLHYLPPASYAPSASG